MTTSTLTAHVGVFVRVVAAVVLAVADPRVQLAQRVVADELVGPAEEGAWRQKRGRGREKVEIGGHFNVTRT